MTPRFWGQSKTLNRANGGTVTTGSFGRAPVHHRGTRSGEERGTPLMALHPSADVWVLAASAAGAPKHPRLVPQPRRSPRPRHRDPRRRHRRCPRPRPHRRRARRGLGSLHHRRLPRAREAHDARHLRHRTHPPLTHSPTSAPDPPSLRPTRGQCTTSPKVDATRRRSGSVLSTAFRRVTSLSVPSNTAQHSCSPSFDT